MSFNPNPAISGTVSKYQSEKASCESQLHTLNTEIAVSKNNFAQLEEKAKATFGTSDINELNNIYANLSTEYTALENDLNQIRAAN